MLVSMSFVDTKHRSISLFVMCSQMKWCQMAMCFVQVWLTEICASAMHPWLSAWIIVVKTYLKSIFSSSIWSQMASFVTFDVAMYSASMVERATIGCFFDDQANLLPAMSNTKSPIDFCVSLSCAQSELVHPIKSTLSVPFHLRISTKCAVPFKYLKTRCKTHSQCGVSIPGVS